MKHYLDAGREAARAAAISSRKIFTARNRERRRGARFKPRDRL